MYTKVALNARLSRKTVGQIHRYLFDFGQGANLLFWIGGRAYIETDCRRMSYFSEAVPNDDRDRDQPEPARLSMVIGPHRNLKELKP